MDSADIYMIELRASDETGFSMGEIYPNRGISFEWILVILVNAFVRVTIIIKLIMKLNLPNEMLKYDMKIIFEWYLWIIFLPVKNKMFINRLIEAYSYIQM